MEEYNYKFSQDSSILILNGVASLVSKLRKLHHYTNHHEFHKHYKYLQEQCAHPKHSVSSSAIVGLINLTQEPDEIIPLQTVLRDIMTITPNIKSMGAIVDLIFYAMFADNKMANYDILKNQHPLITILKKDQACWPHILCKIQNKFQTEEKSRVIQRMQAFTLFVLYDYDQKLDQILQMELLKIYKPYIDNITKQKIIILSVPHIPRSLRYCRILMDDAPQMITYVISAIYELFQYDKDATEAIWILHQHVSNSPPFDYAVAIVMTADCLTSAPISAIDMLCECISKMLATKHYPKLVVSIAKSCLLTWKMHFSTTLMLNEIISKKIDAILNRQYESNDSLLSSFEYLDEKQYIYSYILAHEINAAFLDSLSGTTPYIYDMLFPFLMGFLHDDNDALITLKVLSICMKICEMNVRYTSRLLPVLLYKLSMTLQPDMHLELLRALPKMGVLKENLSVVVMTIKAISTVSVQMHAFAVSLMQQLVRVDKICFGYLEELLMQGEDDTDKELMITRAFVLRDMCQGISTYGLENYRKELAVLVSRSLMRAEDNNMVVGFCFEALKYLCHGFDPYTTMKNLTLRYEDCHKEIVIAGICGIMGEVAYMPDISSKKCEEVIKKLFSYSETYATAPVLDAVYRAVSCFELEQVAMSFPKVYILITDDNSVLGTLVGACWVNLLHFGPRVGLKSATDMLICFIEKTFSTAKPVVMEAREPLYMSLSRDSILAAVAKHVKKFAWRVSSADFDTEVYIQCLRILSTRYVRPLPPMDWAFLNDLKDKKGMEEYVVAIAAQQSGVSGSARRFCENYIKAISDGNTLNEKVTYLYNHMDLLCMTISPAFLRPFFRKTLQLGLACMANSTKEVDLMLEKLYTLLKNPAVSEFNQCAAAEVLLGFIAEFELGSDEMEKVLPVAGAMPRSFLGDYSPVQLKTVNDSIMLRCLAVHCAAACAEEEKPFVFLDQVIDCRILKSCVQPAFPFEKQYIRIAPVFIKHRNHETLAPWLTQLANKMIVELAERRDMRNVIFASTFFIIAVVATSGYYIFTGDVVTFDEFSAVFPFAFAHLLSSKPFAAYTQQILESIYDFITNPNYRRNAISDQISLRFKHGLLQLRQHKSFNEKFCWMKYIDLNF